MMIWILKLCTYYLIILQSYIQSLKSVDVFWWKFFILGIKPERQTFYNKEISVHKHSAGAGAGNVWVRPTLKFHISGAQTLRDTLRKKKLISVHLEK